MTVLEEVLFCLDAAIMANLTGEHGLIHSAVLQADGSVVLLTTIGEYTLMITER